MKKIYWLELIEFLNLICFIPLESLREMPELFITH